MIPKSSQNGSQNDLVRVRVCILVSALSCEFRKDFWDSPDGERRRADRPGAKCTKLAAEER